MNSFASHYALFLAEAVTLALAAVALVAGISILSRRKAGHAGTIYVTDINRQIDAQGVAQTAQGREKGAAATCGRGILQLNRANPV